jgi:hypothetical protein
MRRDRAERIIGAPESRGALRPESEEVGPIPSAECPVRAWVTKARFVGVRSQCLPVHRVFQSPWDKILQSVDAAAHSHHEFASRLERDVESPLRNFAQRKEMQNMHTITANLTVMAKDLEEAKDKADKLNKKGGKANAQKMDLASSKLESASSQWESQAPFIFETLQALDELRINQLRDLLTQLQTHESDQAERNQTTAAETLAAMLEISTAQEIQGFVAKTVAGRPMLEKRTSTRQSSIAPGSSLAPPSSAPHDDDQSDHSGQNDAKSGRHYSSTTYIGGVVLWTGVDGISRKPLTESHRYYARS